MLMDLMDTYNDIKKICVGKLMDKLTKYSKTISKFAHLVERDVGIWISIKSKTVHCNFRFFMAPVEINCVFTLIFTISLLDSRGLYST